MMGLVNLIRLAECYLIFLCLFNELLIQFATAQEGFLSLQCCATSNFTNPKTKITWIPDGNFIKHNGKCQNISIPAVKDDSERIFGTGSGKKWCYSLKTIKGQDYLIRATFLHGLSFQDSPDTAFFDVSIETTIIAQVNKSNEKSSEVEAIFRATDNYINFCLVRRNGNPYLSKLELRPLNDLLYFKNDSSTVLKLLSRIDVGNTKEIIRFPIDRSDRIWNISEIRDGNTNPISNISILVHGANSTVPLQVLQTALADEEQLEFSFSNLDEGDKNYLIHLYFLELDDSVKAGQRVFNVFVNGVKKFDKVDILGDGTSSNYRELVVPVSANGVLNLSLIKAPGVALGPICNAYEILQIHSLAQRTNQADVEKAVELRDELVAKNPENEVLEGWTGEPCLPVPWEGLLCEPISNGSFAIVDLDLSSKDLEGPIPTIAAELTHVKYLNLSFNRFTGAIPSFPVSSMLMSMDVSHNELIGPIPESLAALRHLTKLYFGGNPHFGNYYLPSSFANRLNLTTDFGICGGQTSTSSHPIFIGSVAGGSILFTVTIGVIFACFYRRKMLTGRKFKGKHPVMKNAIFSLPSMDDLGFKSISTQLFTLECIETATHKYNTLIGEGGFGSVYRGILTDGKEVAVKVRSATSTQGTREFENELNLLSAIRHENLVPLLGYCCEYDQQILVYPFMSNGSLQDRLYGEASKRKALDWPTRLSIALGAARGLFYLHTFAGRGVIHRDVKSSNILLDHSMCAKVADFGFSKYTPQEGDSGASLEVRGTAGYLDPEYYSTQHLSAKSDVFSFGVVLLEIISGREPLDIHRPRNEWSLVEWAKPFIRESKIEDIVDPSIKGGYHAEAMWRVVEVALACIEPFSTYRPCMDDIVRELEDALIIENNASEYMKSIDSFGGSNRFPSIDKKINQINLPVTPSTAEPSPIISHALSPPQPR